MEDQLVSIITPVYNRSAHIAEAMDSVLAQTYADWEMLIVDDGSSDGSAEIVRAYMEKDARIRLICNEKNLGTAGSRNVAIAQARGRYLAFLDSDDVWLPEKLGKQLALMQKESVGFCYGNAYVIDEDGSIRAKNRIAPVSITYQKLLYGNPIPCVTVLLDRRMVGEVQMPEGVGHEDYVTWLDVISRISEARNVGEIVAKYRTSERSLSGDKKKAASWQWKIYREVLGFDWIRSVWYFCNYAVRALVKRV